MTTRLLLDPAELRDQIALVRGIAAMPRLPARKRFLATSLLDLLHTLERCARAAEEEENLPEGLPAPVAMTPPHYYVSLAE